MDELSASSEEDDDVSELDEDSEPTTVVGSEDDYDEGVVVFDEVG